MSYRAIFASVVIASALVVSAFLIHRARPEVERNQPTAALVKASGKCAECHRHETSAIIDQFERSRHAEKGVNCLDCHKPQEGQPSMEHRGFTIAKALTAKNCAQCHATEYEQFARSRHAAPAWASVNGAKDMTPEQRALGEKYHPTWVDRAPMIVGQLEGASAVESGCNACHAIGKPNADGSFGTCTNCHARHAASVALAREPTTCGQCHMGPDHSQVEIYGESKHGALFASQHERFNLAADPKKLTTADMSVPTCATCHMSGLEGMKVTHDTTERLSYFLFAPVSTKRPAGDRGKAEMQEVCLKCHTRPRVDDFYAKAEKVLLDTNDKVKVAMDVVASMRAEGLLTPKPFDEPAEYTEFDLWHYYGRTAKHGAYMGGADFVQWHGNYELMKLKLELDHQAAELREKKAKP
ncbi:Hydroxylamine oxidoreductase [Labilithrix luteola]|uniref:Hydroxylamine oxidoreductase n=1 Tax=Labilithrix luteola TaxID=1391654 RepID=A0A0K1Q409_9BACT|nr:multiheme c-type cytochrome [Labilithrix luteola]AKV00377.1 Hydroxylamine oxidoreductase [Labilithrix luteola]